MMKVHFSRDISRGKVTRARSRDRCLIDKYLL